jgi:hypothetical protein
MTSSGRHLVLALILDGDDRDGELFYYYEETGNAARFLNYSLADLRNRTFWGFRAPGVYFSAHTSTQ